uniref:Tumor necrosis factor receptor superfamily member 19 n=1 Tax=Mus musculus TaxID=10090 RepID=Q8BWR1_MOUSE|nr:unnamed protein product [Mus musculus]
MKGAKGTSKVNLVKISSTVSSPRDTALAAVICSALATVLLALLILCVIYCKRQFMEKKPSWSLRSQDIQYNGSELSCFDQPRLRHCAHRACCQYHRDSAPMYGPVHLIPSLCCEEARSSARAVLGCGLRSPTTLQERNPASVGDTMPAFFGSVSRSICAEFSDAWPLMQNPLGGDSSLCDSYPELTGEDTNSLNPENESAASLDSSGGQDLAGTAALESSGNVSESTDSPRHGDTGTVWEQTLAQDAQRTPSQGGWEDRENLNLAMPTAFQDA